MSGHTETTHNEKSARRSHLANIIVMRQDKHQSIEPNELMKAMHEAYPKYSKDECYRDRCLIAQENPFIRDMALYNYSDTVESMFKAIQATEKAAFEDFDHQSGFVRVNSKNIVLKAQEIKEKMLSGKILDISVQLLAKKMRDLQEENKNLKLGLLNTTEPKLLNKW